jgi:hypothetical protein
MVTARTASVPTPSPRSERLASLTVGLFDPPAGVSCRSARNVCAGPNILEGLIISDIVGML